MDTTAQPLASSTPVTPPAQPPAAQAGQDVSASPTPPAPQQQSQAVVDQPTQQSLQGSPSRERGPLPLDATVPVDQVGVPDEVADAADVQREAAPVPTVSETQKPVELSQAEKAVGVEPTPPASQPEEQLAVSDNPDVQSGIAAIAASPSPTAEQEAYVEQTKKKAGFRDSIKWFAELVLYRLKKMRFAQMNQEKESKPV